LIRDIQSFCFEVGSAIHEDAGVQQWMWQWVAWASNATTVVVLAALGILGRKHKFLTVCWVLLIFSVAVGFVAQGFIQFEEHRYSGDLVLRLDAKFDGMKEERAEAARAVSAFLGKGSWDAVSDQERDGLDDVLGFFEEVGFLWKTNRVSAEEVHEYFYDDLRMYCQESLGYMDEQRRELSSSYFENVEPLLEATTRVEAKKIGRPVSDCKWDKDVLEESLKAEIRLIHRRRR
jgi:hypothetical protein